MRATKEQARQLGRKDAEEVFATLIARRKEPSNYDSSDFQFFARSPVKLDYASMKIATEAARQHFDALATKRRKQLARKRRSAIIAAGVVSAALSASGVAAYFLSR